ncbi:hypothetical protein AKJ65_07825 [candidate division MSBL1 archaeon SCGC-AAA259E19]|uniref:Uncharacterized protein n=1 Tax=candidate division MSBL1 archaeon SCGC-AAA259E19 TaxID=1698264 RepID=A0A133UDT8_9EURY|nr:hypothetical protein AKJ65_07825 [candidate division MSBL1 archaeon SCGC-AAA259E19]
MGKILLLWDVKSRGSPATLFYRELRGYEYKTKSGKCHSDGILDELPEDCWDFVSRSALLIEEEHARRVEEVFKKFDRHLKWKKFVVEKSG